jgi:membrane protease YdiL (CAAX protease family)
VKDCQKEYTVSALFEPIILYLVLFFPSFSGVELAGAAIHFSTNRVFSMVFTYFIPALALIWYLIIGKNSLSLNPGTLKPERRDFFTFLWGLSGLVLIGAGTSFIGVRLSPFPVSVIEVPQDVLGWIAMGLSCAGSGYLEESYFRFYLLQKMENVIPNKTFRMLFSTLLFALCHAYEGLWGIVNAVLAGFFLSMLFERNKSLHGIAWAHALYNSLVYIFSSLPG